MNNFNFSCGHSNSDLCCAQEWSQDGCHDDWLMLLHWKQNNTTSTLEHEQDSQTTVRITSLFLSKGHFLPKLLRKHIQSLFWFKTQLISTRCVNIERLRTVKELFYEVFTGFFFLSFYTNRVMSGYVTHIQILILNHLKTIILLIGVLYKFVASQTVTPWFLCEISFKWGNEPSKAETVQHLKTELWWFRPLVFTLAH